MNSIQNIITSYENIMSVLIRLDEEIKQPNITTEEIDRRKNAITYILNKVKVDFGTEIMMNIIALTSVKLGHPLLTTLSHYLQH